MKKKIDLNKLTPLQQTNLRVLKGEPGNDLTWDDLTPEQRDSLKGDEGQSLSWDDLTLEQKASLKGDPGKIFTWNQLTQKQKESLKGKPGDGGENFTWNQLTQKQKEELRPDVNNELIIGGVLESLKQQDNPDEPFVLPKLVKDVVFKLNPKKEITEIKVVYTDGTDSGFRKLATGKTQLITNTVAPHGSSGVTKLTSNDNSVILNPPTGVGVVDLAAGGGAARDHAFNRCIDFELDLKEDHTYTTDEYEIKSGGSIIFNSGSRITLVG